MKKRPLSVMVLSLAGVALGGLFGSFYALGVNDNLRYLTENIHLDMANLYVFILLLMGLAISILLVTAAINAIRLKPWARRAMLLYAWLSVIHEALFLAFNFIIMFPRFKDMVVSAHYIKFVVIESLAVMGMVLVALTYPVALLYFFTRTRVVAAFENILPPGVSMFPVLPTDKKAH